MLIALMIHTTMLNCFLTKEGSRKKRTQKATFNYKWWDYNLHISPQERKNYNLPHALYKEDLGPNTRKAIESLCTAMNYRRRQRTAVRLGQQHHQVGQGNLARHMKDAKLCRVAGSLLAILPRQRKGASP